MVCLTDIIFLVKFNFQSSNPLQVVSLSGSFIRTFEDLHSNWIARQKEIGTYLLVLLHSVMHRLMLSMVGCGVVLAQYAYAMVKKIQFGVAFPMFNGNFTVKPTYE